MLTCSELQKGKMVRLECEISAESKSVTWLKDNREIEAGAKYQELAEGKSQVLLIKDFQSTDQGVYCCVASDEAKTSINLNLEGTSHLTIIVFLLLLGFFFVFFLFCLLMPLSQRLELCDFSSLQDYSVQITFFLFTKSLDGFFSSFFCF